jgi:hypothetical protein
MVVLVQEARRVYWDAANDADYQVCISSLRDGAVAVPGPRQHSRLLRSPNSPAVSLKIVIACPLTARCMGHLRSCRAIWVDRFNCLARRVKLSSLKANAAPGGHCRPGGGICAPTQVCAGCARDAGITQLCVSHSCVSLAGPNEVAKGQQQLRRHRAHATVCAASPHRHGWRSPRAPWH